MSKTLLLVRHSKPESRISNLKDYNRSLTREGISDSIKMAGHLLESGIIPDYILTSSANRAIETAYCFAEVMEVTEGKVISSRNLYYGSPHTILDEVLLLPDEADCLLVIAHNPGISELSRILSSGKSSFMNNTQVSIFVFETEKWSMIEKVKPIVFKSVELEDLVKL